MRTALLSLALLSLFATSTTEAWRWPPDSVPETNKWDKRVRVVGRRVRNVQLRDESDLRNAQRRKDVKSIVDAVFLYGQDHDREIPDAIPRGSALEICKTGAKDCTGMANLEDALGAYLPVFPVDPTEPRDSNGTGYFIYKKVTWKTEVYVTAPDAENNANIKVWR